MSKWKHPKLGKIFPILSDKSPKKVWKHFYNQCEHWERLCDVDVTLLRIMVERAVGQTRDKVSEFQELGPERHGAKPLLIEHHRLHYSSAYLREMRSGGTNWSETDTPTPCYVALTHKSVFLVIKKKELEWRIVTAYRPHPKLSDVHWDEANFKRYGKEFFKKQRPMNAERFTYSVIADLNDAVTAVETTSQLWWLASAVGYGRLCQENAEVHGALQAAELALNNTASSIKNELAASLGWEGLLDCLASALKDERPEDLEAAVIDAEMLLAVAGPVGAQKAAEAFCDEAGSLLAWLPPEWSYLLRRATDRAALFSEDNVVTRFWESLADAALSNVVRETVPVTEPISRIADELFAELSQPAWYGRLTDSVRKLTFSATAAIQEWIQTLEFGLTQPHPVMGADDNPKWELHGRPKENAPAHHKVFVVDDQYPEGYEVTQLFVDGDGLLWRLDDPDDRVLVVILAASAPLPESMTLSELLARLDDRDDIAVRLWEPQPAQPTQATKA